MVSYYPDTITITTQQESTQDGSGDWVQGTTSEVDCMCRAEVSSTDGFIAASDGVKVAYSWKVFLPLDVIEIKPGSQVAVSGTKSFSGTVKQFVRNRFNANAWV